MCLLHDVGPIYIYIGSQKEREQATIINHGDPSVLNLTYNTYFMDYEMKSLVSRDSSRMWLLSIFVWDQRLLIIVFRSNNSTFSHAVADEEKRSGVISRPLFAFYLLFEKRHWNVLVRLDFPCVMMICDSSEVITEGVAIHSLPDFEEEVTVAWSTQTVILQTHYHSLQAC